MVDFKREDCPRCTANGEQLRPMEADEAYEKRKWKGDNFLVVIAAVFLIGQIAAAFLKMV